MVTEVQTAKPTKLSASQVSVIILHYAAAEGEYMSPMKLQHWLYLMQGFSLRIFQRPLFNEDFVAMDFGPVVLSILDEYSSYGAEPIAEFRPLDRSDEADIDGLQAMRVLWNAFQGITTKTIWSILSREDSAWRMALGTGPAGARIEKDLIRDQFEGDLELLVKAHKGSTFIIE